MSEHSIPVDIVVAPAQVWATLATDLQIPAIRLLAQLAFNLSLAQPEQSCIKEASYAHFSEQQ